MCFVDLEKAIGAIPSKELEWAMRKKGIPEVLVISVMSQYEGAKMRVMVNFSCERSLRIKWGCTKDLRCHLLPLQLW